MARRTDAPEDLDEQLSDFENKLSRLRVLYEQYFIGIEKRPPLTLQREVVRIARSIGNYNLRKATHKFRYSALIQRFNVHRAYWIRTTREIENGTFRKHQNRVQRREIERTGRAIDNSELAKQVTLRSTLGDGAVEERQKRIASSDYAAVPERQPYVPAVSRKKKRTNQLRGTPLATVQAVNDDDKRVEKERRVPQLSQPKWGDVPETIGGAAKVLGGAGISEDRARKIFGDLVEARKKQGESVDSLSFQKIVKSMAKQVPKLREKHDARDVDFQVVTKKNKVYLKPVPK